MELPGLGARRSCTHLWSTCGRLGPQLISGPLDALGTSSHGSLGGSAFACRFESVERHIAANEPPETAGGACSWSHHAAFASIMMAPLAVDGGNDKVAVMQIDAGMQQRRLREKKSSSGWRNERSLETSRHWRWCSRYIGPVTAVSAALTMVCIAAMMGCSSAARPGRPVPTRPYAETLAVTVREGTELVAALSPDGRRIAFILLGQVWLIDADGGRAVALTDAVADPHEDWAIAWAPDSRRLAVSANHPAILSAEGIPRSSASLSVVDVDSRTTLRTWRREQIIDVGWPPSDDAPETVEFNRDSTDLWRFPIDSARPPIRERALPRRIGAPAYAPGGRSLAYAGPVSASQWVPTSASDLWEMDLATRAERRLTADSALDGYPAYSPDGRWIAFISERSGTRQLWLLPRDAGEPRPLTRSGEDVYLAPLSWLPDSRGVVYTAAGKIHVAFVDGSAERTLEFGADITVARWSGLRRPELPRPGERHRVRGIVTPELAPDGRRVAFAALGDLWVADVSGGRPMRLTQSVGDEIRPRWSPDGSRLAYVVYAPGTEPQVRILEVDRPERSRTVTVPIGPFDPQFEWSPDGRRLAWVEGNRIGWTDVSMGETRVVASAAGQLLGWSSSGDSIAYATSRASWRVSADSGRPVESNVPDNYASRARWAADLSRAAYAVADRGYRVDVAAGRTPVRLTDPAPRHFSWSTRGHYLLYLSGARVRLLDARSGVARTLEVAPWYDVPEPPPSLLIRNVRIVDGTGGPASRPSDLLVIGGRIAEISAAGAMPSADAVRTIDAGGRTLLPGLMNLHAHQTPSKPLLALNLYNGVLSIRDPGPGSQGEWIQSLRERAEAGELLAPRIFATGGTVTAHDRATGLNSRGVDLMDPRSVADQVASMAAVGTDIIKPYFRNPLLDSRVSEAAHALALPMTSHFLFLGSLARGLEGKEHSHLYYRGWTALYRADVIGALRASNACVTPTLLFYAVNQLGGRSTRLALDTSFLTDSIIRAFASSGLIAESRAWLLRPVSAAARAAWSQREGWDLESVRRLREAGVRVTTGTDVPAIFDEFGVPFEMELLVRAGLTPLEAIRAATLDGASCLGVENELGSVEVGKRADLIIVDGDPTADIRDIRRIAWVVLGGAPYTRQEIIASVRPSGPR
ncbi:MAG: amidohydrolase family protein [Gemmatimonadales bacterium]|nr:amidohydrolase family protein [Gemmatimonadales bacterium]